MATSRSDLGDLDGLVYNLRFVAHTLVKKICMELRATDSETMEALAREPFMREELQNFKRDLCRIVNKACTDVMHAHNELFQMEKGRELVTESALLSKLVGQLLMRKRRYLLARVNAWETQSMKAKKLKQKQSTPRKGLMGGTKGAPVGEVPSPIAVLQAQARGAIERRRMEKLKEEAVKEGDNLMLDDDEMGRPGGADDPSANEDFDEETAGDTNIVVHDIDYFDWPKVFTHYLETEHTVEALSDALTKVLEDKDLGPEDLPAPVDWGDADEDEDEEVEEGDDPDELVSTVVVHQSSIPCDAWPIAADYL